MLHIIIKVQLFEDEYVDLTKEIAARAGRIATHLDLHRRWNCR